MRRSLRRLRTSLRTTGTALLPALLWPALLLSGCASEAPHGQDSPDVLGSFEAVSMIVSPLLGEDRVRTLLPPGTTPHAYAPRPSEARVMHESALVVYAHANIDGWVADMAGSRTYPLFGGLADPGWSTEKEDEHSHSADGHQDAHFWTDPVQVRGAIRPLASALCDTYPDDCAAIRRRSVVLASRLDSLHEQLDAKSNDELRAAGRRCVITAQPFVDQMLLRYTIACVGPITVAAGVPASPGRLSAIIGQAKTQSCSTLVIQSTLQNRFERRLAHEQGWDIVTVDPLGAPDQDIVSYLAGLFDTLTRPASDPEGSIE